ncbi:hypothetical protein Tco_0955670 [Tanacetum coccineum]|uniref:Uncharacterized protein n=1 Tax=Tanacetum coccineum TaxID=301880 RepID=A0ABQ5E7V8_9ASTR
MRWTCMGFLGRVPGRDSWGRVTCYYKLKYTSFLWGESWGRGEELSFRANFQKQEYHLPRSNSTPQILVELNLGKDEFTGELIGKGIDLRRRIKSKCLDLARFYNIRFRIKRFNSGQISSLSKRGLEKENLICEESSYGGKATHRRKKSRTQLGLGQAILDSRIERALLQKKVLSKLAIEKNLGFPKRDTIKLFEKLSIDFTYGPLACKSFHAHWLRRLMIDGKLRGLKLVKTERMRVLTHRLTFNSRMRTPTIFTADFAVKIMANLAGN